MSSYYIYLCKYICTLYYYLYIQTNLFNKTLGKCKNYLELYLKFLKFNVLVFVFLFHHLLLPINYMKPDNLFVEATAKFQKKKLKTEPIEIGQKLKI